MEYNVDDYGVLRVYDHNRIIAEVSECEGMTDTEVERLATEVYDEWKSNLTEEYKI